MAGEVPSPAGEPLSGSIIPEGDYHELRRAVQLFSLRAWRHLEPPQARLETVHGRPVAVDAVSRQLRSWMQVGQWISALSHQLTFSISFAVSRSRNLMRRLPSGAQGPRRKTDASIRACVCCRHLK